MQASNATRRFRLTGSGPVMMVAVVFAMLTYWGAMVAWQGDTKYPELPFRGFIALSSTIVLGVALSSFRRTTAYTVPKALLVTLGLWCVTCLLFGASAWRHVGGVALIAIAVLGLLAGGVAFVWTRLRDKVATGAG